MSAAFNFSAKFKIPEAETLADAAASAAAMLRDLAETLESSGYTRGPVRCEETGRSLGNFTVTEAA